MNVHPFAPLGADELNANPAANDMGPDWTPIVPVPDDAPSLTRAVLAGFAPAGYGFTRGWRYNGTDGSLLCAAVRFDRPANGVAADKQVLPLTFCQGPKGRREWRRRAVDGPRPLYGFDTLAQRPDAPVIVVEGEKAADAAEERFPDQVAVTSPGGSNAAHKADWSPLMGRAITIWPDADESGAKYASAVADACRVAGARSVRIVMVPDGFPNGWDLADALPAGVTDAQLVSMLEGAADAPVSTPSAPVSDPWRSPDLSLLGTGRRPAPVFPAQILGPFWQAWCERRAAAASAPVDYVATSLLASVGAMIANVRWPVAGANWSEPPVLWCAVVGSPSSSKSPAMDAAFDLVRHAEEQMAAGFDDEQRRHETTKQIARAKREAWEGEVKAAIKNGATPAFMPEDATVPDEPIRPRVRVADVTVEKLAALAAGLPRGMLMVRDELAGWFGAFDKYGGGGSDRAFAIEMYDGRSYVVDRMKNPEPFRIRHLSVGVLGGVQPDKLPAIITGPDDGLASRLLWSWPDVLPDFRLARLAADDHDAQVAFARLADLAMGSDELGNPEPKRLKLTRDAEDVLEEFAREMSKTAHEATGIFAGALGKSRGHALRVAAIIEHLWWCGQAGATEPQAISAQAVEAAAGLLDAYYVPMAERVFGDAAIPADERAAMMLIRFAKRHGLVSFNARDLRRDIGGSLREATAMDAACNTLVEAGLIRNVGTRAGSTAGRVSKTFEINPAVLRRAA